VAATSRTSTLIGLCRRPNDLPFLKHSQSFTWMVGEVSPTSSRKNVRLGDFEEPLLVAYGAVKDPFTWPKSFAFEEVLREGTAVNAHEGLLTRFDLKWISLAMSSFPVPLSPKNEDGAVVSATFSTSLKTLSISSLLPRSSSSRRFS